MSTWTWPEAVTIIAMCALGVVGIWAVTRGKKP